MPGHDCHFLTYRVELNYDTKRWEVKHASGYVVADTRTRNEALLIRRRLRAIQVDITDTLQRGSSEASLE